MYTHLYLPHTYTPNPITHVAHICPSFIHTCQHNHACAYMPHVTRFHVRVNTIATCTQTYMCVYFMYTPTCTHLPLICIYSPVCTHGQYTHILTHVPHTQPTHSACACAPNTHGHTHSRNNLPTLHWPANTLLSVVHIHIFSRESVHGVRVWGVGPLDRRNLASQLPPCLGLCLCSCSLSPKCGEGAGRATSGRGQTTVALIKNFTPPRGPAPLQSPHVQLGESPKLALFTGFWGFQGPHSGRYPSQLRGLGSKCFGGLFCAWVLPAPAGCSAEGQQAPNGLQRPLLNCPFPGLIIGRCWRGYGPQILQFHMLVFLARLSTCDFKI